MDNFHYDLVGDMDDLEKLLGFGMNLEDSTFVKISDFVYFCGGVGLFVMD